MGEEEEEVRCLQIIGLKNKARAYLEKNVKREPGKKCPKCGEILSTTYKIIDTEFKDYFYGDGVSFNTYEMKDGKKIKEVEQESPWASGPCVFLCLENENGRKLFKWTEEEIEENL